MVNWGGHGIGLERLRGCCRKLHTRWSLIHSEVDRLLLLLFAAEQNGLVLK
jgi:hypothetical protein